MNINQKPIYKHLIAVLIFIALPCLYLSPLLNGKVINQGDVYNFLGVSKEIQDYRKEFNKEPLWTNSLFGGMPAFQLSVKYEGNLLHHIDDTFLKIMPYPIFLIFICFLGFYILLCSLKINPWLSIIGAIAYGMSTYFFVILEAGHNSKAHTLAYTAFVFAGIIYIHRGKFLLGGIMTAFFLALQIRANHFQISYYFALFLSIYFLFKLIDAIKEKALVNFGKSTAVIALAVILAVGANISNLVSTLEYSKYTTRGKSELTLDGLGDKTSGLDKSYATAWSYGIGESMSLLIPNFKGGGSGSIGQDNADVLKKIEPQMREAVGSMDRYWGDQPFTSGPVYAGCIVLFLFIVGLFIIDGTLKWVMLIATILSIMLAWGKNFMPLTEFFLDYFPGYNKFRAVSMILVVVELTLPLLAFIALDKIVNNPELLQLKKKQFYISLALTGGLSFLLFLAPDAFTSFEKSNEFEQLYSQFKSSNSSTPDTQIKAYLEQILPSVGEARKAIFKSDALRSTALILIAAVLLFLYSKNKLKKSVLISAFALLIVGDMWLVNRRYLNKDSFVVKAKMDTPFQPTSADKQILQDKDPNFRVFNTTMRLDQDSRTSYFHKSLGGYHGAKLKRYQELIDYQLGRGNMEVINMMNTKYVIVNTANGLVAQRNPEALGNAWFVNELKYVANADSEITALSHFEPAQHAIIDQRYKETIGDFEIIEDSNKTISLTSYLPNDLTYFYKSTNEQFAVFSEIYYDKGWNAYVDGKETPYVRVNYVLRGMRLPAGQHTVEFKFEPKVYYLGEKVATACSALIILLVLGLIFKTYNDSKKME